MISKNWVTSLVAIAFAITFHANASAQTPAQLGTDFVVNSMAYTAKAGPNIDSGFFSTTSTSTQYADAEDHYGDIYASLGMRLSSNAIEYSPYVGAAVWGDETTGLDSANTEVTISLTVVNPVDLKISGWWHHETGTSFSGATGFHQTYASADTDCVITGPGSSSVRAWGIPTVSGASGNGDEDDWRGEQYDENYGNPTSITYYHKVFDPSGNTYDSQVVPTNFSVVSLAPGTYEFVLKAGVETYSVSSGEMMSSNETDVFTEIDFIFTKP